MAYLLLDLEEGSLAVYRKDARAGGAVVLSDEGDGAYSDENTCHNKIHQFPTAFWFVALTCIFPGTGADGGDQWGRSGITGPVVWAAQIHNWGKPILNCHPSAGQRSGGDVRITAKDVPRLRWVRYRRYV